MRLKRSLATLLMLVLVLGSMPIGAYAKGNGMGYNMDNAFRLDYDEVAFFSSNDNKDENGTYVPYLWSEFVAGVSEDYTIKFERIPENGSLDPKDMGPTPYITDAKIFDVDGNELPATCVAGETTVLRPTNKLEKNRAYYIQAFFNSHMQSFLMTIPGERHIRPTKSWEITYDLNGGTGTAPVDTEWYFGSDTDAFWGYLYSPDNDPVAPAQGNMIAPTGATFAGWKDGNGKAYAVGDKIASTSNVTLYAQWKVPSSAADASSTVYAVDDIGRTVAGGSSGITTAATVQGVLANMTFSEKATYKIVASGQDLSSVGNAAGAAAKEGADRIVSGDQLVVIAENGTDYAVYTITATAPVPTIGMLAIPKVFTAGSNITLGDLATYVPSVAANGATITAQGWQSSVTSGGGSDSWTTWTAGGELPVDTSSTFKLRYYVTCDGTTVASNAVTLNVVGKATALALTVSPASPQSTGTPITLTATLTGFFAGPGVTGQTITFKNGSETLGTAALNAGGVATYTWTPVSAKTYSLTAEYSATAYNAAATSNTVNWESTASAPTDWNGVIPASNTAYVYSGGSGTAASPYLIANSYDLAMLSSNVNTVKDYSAGKYFKMTADIDLNPGITVTDANAAPKGWTPIGIKSEFFKGVFDGGGFVVKGMYVKDLDKVYSYGLFGNVDNAKIQNLGVTGGFVNITIANYSAGVVGYCQSSTVENCYNTSKIVGYYSVSGIVGACTLGSLVKSCYNVGDIQGAAYIGGIVGQSMGNIQDCYNTGNISGTVRAGGIAGVVFDSQSTGVKCVFSVTRCYNTGNVTTKDMDAGGVVGKLHIDYAEINEVRADNCISLGQSVISEKVPDQACRVAQDKGTISNAYARADMTVNGALVSNGTLTNLNGKGLSVSQSTAQDWSTWFGTGGASAWNYPADGKLWYGAPLPTLKGVGGTQNPTLPGTVPADTTPPTLAAGAANRTSETAATVKFTSNEGGTYYYSIGSPVTNTSTGGQAFSAGETTITLTGLTAGAKDIYIVAKDAAGNASVTTFKMTIPAYVSSDTATVNNAKAAAESASYKDMTQAVSTSEDIIKSALKETAAAAINDNSVTVAINEVSYTAPVAGTAANPSGTDGKYVFTVTISKGGQKQTTAQKTITITATPYTAAPTYDITGTVKDHTDNPASGASVRLLKGNTPIGTQSVTTDVNGDFTITEVPNGRYNLVVSKGDITVTTLVVVNNGNNTLTSAIRLPKGKTNSIVVVKPNTPDIVVGGLDGLFGSTAAEKDKGFTADDKDLVENSGCSVTIKLTAQSTDHTAPNANAISAAAQSGTKTIGAFLDLTVLKTVTDSSNAELTAQSANLVELPALIEVRIPLDTALKGKTGYMVYRYHGAGVDTLTTNPNGAGEYFTVEPDMMTLHAKKFSTYAIAYQTVASPVNPSTGGGSGGGSGGSAPPPTITAEPSEGGKIDIGSDKKTATLTPEEGYVIADVLMDGMRIGAVDKYTFNDGKPHRISGVFAKKSALPYYTQGDKKTYIGFSAVSGNVYNYIAPTGVKVEFKENPKSFTDNIIPWAKPSVDFVTERELFLGTTQATFGPNDGMTRAMFVAAMGRLYERSYGSISGAGTFADVDANAYYAKYVSWANENGIIKGVGESKFAPNQNVTREQMAAIMQSFAELLKKADVKGDSLAYADSDKISPWAIEGAKYCQETKVITGRNGGAFAPQESATRAEVAAVIERFIKIIVK